MTAVLERLGTETLPHAASSAREARRIARGLAAPFIADEDMLFEVDLLVSEAVTNAYLHGTGDIRVAVAVASKHIRVEVCDHGPRNGFDPRGDNGRGLDLIRATTREWKTHWGLELSSDETRLWFEVPV